MSHFVYDLVPLSTDKADLSPIPTGADPKYYIQALADWIPLVQAALDIRDVLLGAKFYGFGAQSADPAPAGTSTYLWLRSDYALMLHSSGANNQLLSGARQILTDQYSGLQGGGNLNTDLTLALQDLFDSSWTPQWIGTEGGPWNYVQFNQRGQISHGELKAYVLETRQVQAGAGLTGGGTLDADITIEHPAMVGLVAGQYNLLTVDTYGHVTAASLESYVTSGDLSSYVLSTRTVSAGTGLSGGGDLSANRTISHASAGTATQGPYNNASYDALGHFVSGSLESYLSESRRVDTADRLAGGGDLSADLTLDLAELDPDPSGSVVYAGITVDKYGRVTAASGGAPPLRQMMALALNDRSDSATWQVLTDLTLNPDNYPSPAKIKFVVTGFVTTSGTTGYVKLYNLTDGVDVSGAAFSFTDQEPLTQASAVLTLPAGNKMYEVRVRLAGGAPGDELDVQWAGMQIDPT